MHRAQQPLAFPALLIGSILLAIGPWLVRLAGTGPVAAGFWRLALALPFLFLIARVTGQPVHWPGRALAILTGFAAFFFAADLAAWHVSIHMTKLGNATLFGNVSSFAFAAWGLWLARSWPTPVQGRPCSWRRLAPALLMGSSADLSVRHLQGDLLALVAGVLYAGYLIAVQTARGKLGAMPLLFLSSAFGAAMLLPLTLVLGEQDRARRLDLRPHPRAQQPGRRPRACSSTPIGSLSPLVVGLTLLTQPAISALVGWWAYGETLSPLDWAGAIAIGAALVLVRLPQRGLREPPGAAS